MERNLVGWFEIYVEDMERAIKFYEQVFDLKLDRFESPDDSDVEMYFFPMKEDAPDASGALVKHKLQKPHSEGTIVYFNCEDCAVEEARVEAYGGKVGRQKMSIGPFGFISLVYDSEGNMIGLHSKK